MADPGIQLGRAGLQLSPEMLTQRVPANRFVASVPTSKQMSSSVIPRLTITSTFGKQRPLAIAALEDKIVQSATVMVLNAIYEGDFVGFSYGFRPGRGPHDGLDALSTAIKIRRVNWIR